MSVRNDRKLFLRPALHHRPLALWIWNDELTADRVRSQFDALIEGGFGGAIVQWHPDSGETAYLSDRWFEALAGAVKRAKKLGAELWLSAEFGHAQTSKKAIGAHAAQRLVMHDLVITSDQDREIFDDAVASFVVTHSDATGGVQRRGGGLALVPDRIAIAPIIFDVAPAQLAGRRMLVFRVKESKGHWNLLDSAVGEEMIRGLYEEHRRRLGRALGTTITRFYTCDVQIEPGPSELPWDVDFDALFRETRGYSLVPHLPSLFFETSGCETHRYDYWSLVGELFREGLIGPIAEWCAARRIGLSGHAGYLPTLKEAVRNAGLLMPMSARLSEPVVETPGNEKIAQRIDTEAYSQRVVSIKQVASIQRQLGRSDALSESFRASGHGVTPEDLGVSAHLQAVLGVTRVIHYAAPYSLRGDRKIDLSPIIGPQQPWWKIGRGYFEALSRLHWLSTQGRAVCDVLVLHPGSSIQAAYRHFRREDEAKREGYLFDANLAFETLDTHFAMLSSALLDAQIDFDYGDEIVMSRNGAAENKTFRVGKAAYRIVLLPPLLNIRRTTLELLQDFAVCGGIIIAAGSAPRLLDGRPSEEPATFLSEYAERLIDGVEAFEYRQLTGRLTALGCRTVRILDTAGNDVRTLKVQRRECDDKVIFLMVNLSQHAVEAEVRLRPDKPGRIEEWDCATGSSWGMAECVAGEELSMPLTWAPGQLRVLVRVPDEQNPLSIRPPTGSGRVIRPEWRGRRSSPNTLVLRECQLTDGGPRLSVTEVRVELFKRIKAERTAARITTWWPFQVSPIIPWTEACQGVLELAKDASARLNGEEIYFDVVKVGRDPSMRIVNLPRLRLGENILELTGTYSDPWSFEGPSISGDFRVNHDGGRQFIMEFDSGPVALGGWADRGMPFYAGSVVYRAEVQGEKLGAGQRVALEAGRVAGAAEVRVDGAIAGQILCPPYRCDLTEHWTARNMNIEVEVANSLRNLFGPHFALDEGHRTWFTREDFEAPAGAALQFEECGLIEAPIIVVETPF